MFGFCFFFVVSFNFSVKDDSQKTFLAKLSRNSLLATLLNAARCTSVDDIIQNCRAKSSTRGNSGMNVILGEACCHFLVYR